MTAGKPPQSQLHIQRTLELEHAEKIVKGAGRKSSRR